MGKMAGGIGIGASGISVESFKDTQLNDQLDAIATYLADIRDTLRRLTNALEVAADSEWAVGSILVKRMRLK